MGYSIHGGEKLAVVELKRRRKKMRDRKDIEAAKRMEMTIEQNPPSGATIRDAYMRLSASQTTARDLALEIIADTGLPSGGKHNRAVRATLMALGQRKNAKRYSRNNAGANLEAIVQAIAAHYGLDDSHLTYTSGAPRDARLNTIPRATR